MSNNNGARVFALAAEAWGGRGGIAQSTRDLLESWAEMPGVAQIEVLPRLQAEDYVSLPARITQLSPSMGKVAYTRRALWHAMVSRPDIVYCGHAFMAPLAHLVARTVNAKLVAHVHGLEVWQPLSTSIKRGLAACDRVLCVSKHTASKLNKVAGIKPSRRAVIYNTVDERFTPGDRSVARQRFEIPQSTKVLSTVARLDPSQRHKGHDRVIPLLAEIAREVPNLIYLVAGSGDDRVRLENLAKSTGVESLVRFLGFVADEDLPDLYRASDLYVMPSHGEGFGIAFVEAMCCGTPALGLDAGGAGDALRNGELGRAVSEADFPSALRAAVLAPPSNRDHLAARARAAFGRSAFADRVSEATAVLLPCPAARRAVAAQT